ncbi:LuxR family transcriptional regulator, maltose regulon positive regulatory protein [Rhodococcus triatomae]|uniref:LuxR family transcriptional regulator, maltose regulon positive regulatory protein n=1 Tax=Rhodococcus triatomae TaxID=300028 RepID=A0A1G8IEQ5_9NOCA|nr:LuxR family transcriptional regulator, maltose regulon positive regulatory protein [Rhodococcus triatomae]
MPRERLLDALRPVLVGEQAADVALICAPAGSGKTRLLSDAADRLAGEPDPPVVVWITAQDDSSATDFANACLRAVRATGDQALVEACSGLEQGPSDFGAQLAEALATAATRVHLVIDDAHLLAGLDVLSGLETYLRHQPAHVRTVISGRFEPPLALQRLRLDGRLFEVTADDLALSPDEASAILGQHGVRLDSRELAALMERTEGWAAGIRLAGMSLAGHADHASFIDDFRGDRRPVADYLIEEVLAGTPDPVRDVLLHTSVPESFTVELAEDLSRRADAGAQIEWLERHNFLITRIEGAPVRFRYHPLLRSYLRAEITRLGRRAIGELETTVSQWHEDFGEPLVALEHAVNAADTELIVRVLERSGLPLVLDGHGDAVEVHLARAPRRVLENSVVRSIHAAVSVHSGRSEVAAAALADSAPALDHRAAVLTEALRTHIAVDDGGLPGHGTHPEATGYADLDAYAALQHGRALTATGDLDAADRVLTEARSHARYAVSPRIAAHTAAAHAVLAVARGTGTPDCHAAVPRSAPTATAEDTVSGAIGILAASTISYQRGENRTGRSAALAYRLLREHDSDLARFATAAAEFYDLADAERDESSRAASPGLHAVLARVHASLHPLPTRAVPRPLLAALLPAVLTASLAAGEARRANDLVRDVASDPDSVAEVALLRALVSIHDHHWDAARRTVAPIVSGEVSCRARSGTVAAWLVEAQAAVADARTVRAHEALTSALELAEPGSLVRPFHEAGSPVRDLLAESSGRFGGANSFAEHIRATFPSVGTTSNGTLTRRELELLLELPTWRTSEQIAADLCVSVNTVKTHLRGIYRKLGVNSRRGAIAAARQQGLL